VMGLPQPTLADLLRVLADPGLRLRLMRNPELSETVVGFWDRYNRLTPKQQEERAVSTLPRLNELLAKPVMGKIVSHPRSTMRLADWLDQGKLVVLNLGSKFDAETSRLLGNFVVASLVSSAYARPTVNERPDLRIIRLIVDEFHQLAGEQFAELVEQGRKYAVFPVVAHQNLSQLNDRLSAAVTSCPLRYFLRISPDDQSTVRRLFGAAVGDGLAHLPKFHARVQLPNEPRSETLKLDGWWSERREAQLRAAQQAAEDDRFTVLLSPAKPRSEPPIAVSDEVSDSSSDTMAGDAAEGGADEATTGRHAPAGKRLLDAWDAEPVVDPEVDQPDPSRSQPKPPVAPQAHPPGPADLGGARPARRLLDQWADH
jgi:hypothetical protein